MPNPRKTILVAVDFGAASTQALKVAKDLAHTMDADLVLAHVYALPQYAYPGTAPMLFPALEGDIAAAAQRALDDLSAVTGAAKVELRQGDAATQILEIIAQVRPLFVVVGTHGRHGVPRLVLGSVAEELIRKSPVPVVTVHAPT